MSGSLDPYKVLGIGPDATPDEIRQAYHRAAQKYHPDAGGDAWVFQQVQSAYNHLRSQSSASVRKPAPAKSKTTSNERPRTSPTHEAEMERNAFATSTAAFTAETASTAPQRAQPTGAEQGRGLESWLFGKPLRLHNETSYFIFANFMDVIMTGILLRYSAVEANPIANFVYQRYGFIGMVALKLASVVLVVVVAQAIAPRSQWKARALLVGGTLLVSAVVVYSIFLARYHIHGH